MPTDFHIPADGTVLEGNVTQRFVRDAHLRSIKTTLYRVLSIAHDPKSFVDAVRPDRTEHEIIRSRLLLSPLGVASWRIMAFFVSVAEAA